MKSMTTIQVIITNMTNGKVIKYFISSNSLEHCLISLREDNRKLLLRDWKSSFNFDYLVI